MLVSITGVCSDSVGAEIAGNITKLLEFFYVSIYKDEIIDQVNKIVSKKGVYSNTIDSRRMSAKYLSELAPGTMQTTGMSPTTVSFPIPRKTPDGRTQNVDYIISCKVLAKFQDSDILKKEFIRKALKARSYSQDLLARMKLYFSSFFKKKFGNLTVNSNPLILSHRDMEGLGRFLENEKILKRLFNLGWTEIIIDNPSGEVKSIFLYSKILGPNKAIITYKDMDKTLGLKDPTIAQVSGATRNLINY